MSSKKALLKAAQEAIAQGSYRDALAHCKAVLAEDKISYQAYVLVGKAAFFLKEHGQAEAAYKRASELEPNALMAWQGFAELFSETGQWADATAIYATLVGLTSAAPDEAVKARSRQFLRKQADSAVRAELYEEAESCLKQLLATTNDGVERLELLCLLADVQLGFDRQEVESRVHARMEQAILAEEAVSEAVVRQAVEAEWAEEGLEMETDHACATLRDIIAEAPPSPRYAQYYEAYLRRLRKYVYSAPPSSTERHNRRIAVLQFSKFMIAGRSGSGVVGGCCSVAPYEAALAMLELEGEIVGPTNLAASGSDAAPGSPPGPCRTPPLALAESNTICQRLAFTFPWTPQAGVHLALAMRRRALLGPAAAKPSQAAGGQESTFTTVVGLPPTTPQQPALPPSTAHRKFMLRELLAGLKRGVVSAAGWLAAADMLLSKHQQLEQQVARGAVPTGGPAAAALESTAQGALDATKEGLKYVAHRDFLGKEHMEQAGLLLRLAAARALVALGACPEAEALLVSLAERVSEGSATFGLLAGVPPVSVSQQAVRLLAQAALAQGERCTARRLYESLVGRGALGRNAEAAEPWAHAEYGWLMKEEGELEVARQQLEEAVALLEQQLQREQRHQAHALTVELAVVRLKLAQVYWALGGELRAGRGSGAQAALMASAAVDGPHQAQAFSWLGRWYLEVVHDEPRARKCFQRALALDPEGSHKAGEALVGLLVQAGEAQLALEMCSGITANTPALWAWRCLANLQLSRGQADAAVMGFQRVLRAMPDDAELWQGLGAAYLVLGRHTAALKAFTRSLELNSSSVYCLLQSAAIHQQLGALGPAEECYRHALDLSPDHPAALLGLAETKFASAQLHWRLGAGGVAALDLEAASSNAAACAARHGNLPLAWKLLGDALLQQTGCTPLPDLKALAGAAPGQEAAQAAVRALDARAKAMRAARVAYCKTLHLDPMQGLVWGDAAVTAQQEALLTQLISDSPAALPAADATVAAQHDECPISAPASPAALLVLAQRLVQGGLQIEPSSDWLWACAGTVAQNSSERREFCWSRALQLNPKRAVTWAALGRLYAQKGDGSLAQQCFEHARSHEPTLVCIWEAMGNLAGTASQAPGDAAYKDMMDAYQHAVGLGGGLESRLAYAAGALKGGAGSSGEVFAAASKCCQQLPTLAAGHNALGLAAEARGHLEQAMAAFETALALLPARAVGGVAEGEDEGPDGAASLHTGYLGIGPGSSGLALQASTGLGDRDPQLLRAAVRLNLARALAKQGQDNAAAAQKSVAIYKDLQSEGWMQSDHVAWLAYAAALERAGGAGVTAQVSDALQAALAAAGTDAGRAEDAEGATAAGIRRLSCALILCKQLVSQGDWDTAHSVVQQETQGPVTDATCASLTVQLWLVLLAGATAASAEGDRTLPQEFRDLVVQQLLSWVQTQAGVADEAEVRAQVVSIDAASAAAAGRFMEASRVAAAAVHLCPGDARWRLQLASYALSASPGNALAAARASRLEDRSVPTSVERLAATPPRASGPTATMTLRPLVASMPIATTPAPATSTREQPSALTPAIPFLWPCDPGDSHVVRASGLVSTLPLPQLEATFAAEVLRLTRLVHTHPDSTVAWYLLALVSLQLAAAVPGHQCRLYRHALVRCRAALARVRGLHRRLQGLASTAPAGASSILPLAAMVNAAAVAAMARQRDRAARSSREKALEHLVASMILRLLAASSECQLHSRRSGCQQAARDAANEALQWAVQHELSPALAQRQLGRVLWALGDTSGAELALQQAAKSEDLAALLEYASLLTSTGQEEAARQLLTSALQDRSDAEPGSDEQQTSRLLAAASLLPAKLLLDLQELEAARHLLVDELLQQGTTPQQHGGSVGKVPAGAVAAGLALQAQVALRNSASQAGEADKPGEAGASNAEAEALPAMKRLALEARWAATGSLRQLEASGRAGQEAALVHLLLGQAEVARGRADKAYEDLSKAAELWGEPKPVDLLARFHSVAGRGRGAHVKADLARVVRAEPWNARSWQQLRAPKVVADA